MSWAFWIELAVRSAIVLAVCEALRRLFQRVDAAGRYRIAFSGFGALAALPFLTALLPGISLPIRNWLPGRATVTVETGRLMTSQATTAHVSSARFNWILFVWAAGAVIGLLWIAAGNYAVWRLSKEARPLREGRWLALAHELSAAMGLRLAPQILTVDGPAMPVTFGILRPKILLPAQCTEWTPLRWRVVLLHELAHIERRDVAAQLFANLASALWWFQPLVWRARQVLRQESERACDARALALGIRASEYAEELLEIARRSRFSGATACAAIGMAGTHLEGRLREILQPRRATGRGLALIAILTMAAFGTAASAINLGGSPMKRTILSGLLASASLSAATLGGSIYDPGGSAIGNATVMLTNADTSAEQQTTSSADGKFSFDGLPAGQYILHVEKSGFKDLLSEFTLAADSNVQRGLTLKSESAQQPIRVKGEIEQANLVTKIMPVYPPAAKAARVQGKVILDAVIDATGTPTEINVVSSPSDDLTQSALNAVRQWRYRPVLLNGQPVSVKTEILVNYTLSQ